MYARSNDLNTRTTRVNYCRHDLLIERPVRFALPPRGTRLVMVRGLERIALAVLSRLLFYLGGAGKD